MDCNDSPISWALIGKIHSVQSFLDLDHGNGRLSLEIVYLRGIPIVVARVDFLSAGIKRSTQHYKFELEDLPSLLEHAAQVLRDSLSKAEQTSQKIPTVG